MAQRPALEERLLFNDPIVRVTSRLVSFSTGTMMPTAQISAVQMLAEREFNFGIIGLGVFVLAFFGLAVGGMMEGAYVALALAAASFPVGMLFTRQRYWILVTSGGTTTRAVWSRDLRWASDVIAAIRESITR